jgi:hypothetical protein
MKKLKIENRKLEINDGRGDFLMVDLTIDDEKIDTGDNPISSHSFWKDIQNHSQRALYRIERDNPKMNFDFNLASMDMTDEQKAARFKSHIKGKYPDMEVDAIFEVIENEVKEIEMTGPDDNHPNPFFKFPIGSDMTKNFIISIVSKLQKKEEKNG